MERVVVVAADCMNCTMLGSGWMRGNRWSDEIDGMCWNRHCHHLDIDVAVAAVVVVPAEFAVAAVEFAVEDTAAVGNSPQVNQ